MSLPGTGADENAAALSLPAAGADENAAVSTLPGAGGDEDGSALSLPGAGGDEDAAALSLPSPGAAAVRVGAAPLSMTAEAAVADIGQRAGGAVDEQRMSVDLRDDSALSADWRFIFGDRLDSDWYGSWSGSQQINTLKQAYVSWQPEADLIFDAGRINARQGVAFGYNPTDFLRAGALRTIDSLDPNSLRDERLGTAMVRGESLWNGGAFSASYAPRLTANPSTAPFDPDWGATNSEGHWLMTLTQRVGPSLTPQWLLYGREGGSPQVGLNVTRILGGATVAFLEASGGRSASQWAQAQGLGGSDALRTRAAAGLSYSAANKLSLTLEYEYDAAALGSRGWSAARLGDPRAYGRYRDFALVQQELPTRQAAFVYASWQDVGIRHLDLSAFVRVDLIDRSLLPWTELRYHWPRFDAALRWQDSVGGASTDYGASPSRQTWQALLDYYL